jgi:Domain of unknown function (DUF4159)
MRRAAMLALVLAAGGAAVLAADYAGGTQSEVRQAFPGNVEYDGRVTFVRIRYNSGFGGGGFSARGSRGEPPWAHDYPTSDRHLMRILKELTVANPHVDESNVLTLDDPDLLDYPIAYMSEPGYWTMSEEEAKGLRVYLQKGGFIIFDDFRDNHWYNLEEQMKKVMPEARWVILTPEATVFNSFFEITNFNFGAYGKETYFGIFEDNDPNKRLMAVAGHNQDLGEFWEFSDTGMMPVDLSNEAYKFGVNYFIYGLIH